ncbi:MAG TPA: inorganic diphosphatase [Fimbriimonadaceae bacterium]|nr:inorganic diphosphatase [Fimbriimonadaceae bacterium]HRJ95054.1 inorganic diphosphatase [Fimbriimonadaceae bacterium]
MSLLEVPIGPNPPSIVNVIVEIPRGSTNKYEIDAKTGIIRLDRVLYSPLFYPFDYGYIPQTHYLDGDPLDALVLVTHPTFPGCVIESRPVAVLAMRDDKGSDEKILCVATVDPRFRTWSSLADLNEHVQKEIIHFFEVYKTLEQKEVDVLGWLDVDAATRLVEKYRV